MSIGLNIQTDFECLTNELLLDLFTYLNTSHIYHAFQGLNFRFDSLIVEYFRTRRINFQSISKADFELILQDHLKPMTHQITSLCISDGDDTPGQIDQFFSSGFSLSRFENLRSLCLDNIRSPTTMNQIMLDLPSLQLLTHLTIKQCYYPSSTQPNLEEQRIFANAIWGLPKLEYCSFKVDYKYRQSHHFVNRYRRDQSIILNPTVTSSSLKYLSITGFDQCQISMNQLFERTPSLKSLSLDHWNHPEIEVFNASQSISHLSVSFIRAYETHLFLELLLRRFSALIHFKIDFYHSFRPVSGGQWEHVISNHLPQLEKLEFRMPAQFSEGDPQGHFIDHYLRSFRSQFWLEQRHWYVQCDWVPERNYAVFYTTPYAFNYFQIIYPMRSKSTHPNGNDYRSSYDHVQHLLYKPRYGNMPSVSHIQLHHIQHLSIQLPVTEHFSSFVPTLDHLVSLDVLSEDHNDHCQQQLQNLLDRAPRLSSIRISWKNLTSSLMQLFHSQHLSVYQLELLWFGGHFTKEQCVALDNILPGIHCSVLNLNISDRICILELVKTMHHLRALNVEYPKKQKTISQDDTTCQWLREQLSPLLPNVIVNRQENRIRLWLR